MDLCYCPRSHADINMERSFDDCSFHEGRDEENSLMGRVEHNMEELFSEMNVAEEEIEVVELKAGGIRALLVDGRIVREEINTEDVSRLHPARFFHDIQVASHHIAHHIKRD